MSSKNFRKEPVFSDSDRHQNHDHDELIESRLPPRDNLDLRLRLAAIAVLFVCSVFLIDWGIQKYREYQAVQMIKGAVESLERAGEAAQREAERRRLALRDQRAKTNQGEWLAKNCSDWRRAYDDLGAPTAEREMRRHCRIYEQYLDTGIAATPVS